MTANQQSEIGVPPIQQGVTEWAWPVSPSKFVVYDKYADVTISLGEDESVWALPVRGKTSYLKFFQGEGGALQRKLVMLTQSNAAPSSIEKFGFSLVNNWSIYVQILEAGYTSVRKLWDERVLDVDVAKAGKSILKLACKASVGPWRPLHLSLVTSLSTRAKEGLQSQRGKLKRRERLLSIDQQAALTRVLDDAAGSELSESDAEGLAALALFYQHGMRPVQLLSLRMEHVRLLSDAENESACIVSFHAAKQSDGKAYEELRQVKPEWVPLVAQLIMFARLSGRRKLFSSTNSEQLWAKVRSACRVRAFKVEFTAKVLRHTSAQTLADAGQDRESIRRFLAQANQNSARVYHAGSLHQGKLLNEALGASKLYQNIIGLSEKRFISIDELMKADDDRQVGGVVGERLIGGVGLCRSGQSSCRYNPVTSCYGCFKFIPCSERVVHEEAIAGMREQVLTYVNFQQGSESPAYLQLKKALAGAQQTIHLIDNLEGSK